MKPIQIACHRIQQPSIATPVQISNYYVAQTCWHLYTKHAHIQKPYWIGTKTNKNSQIGRKIVSTFIKTVELSCFASLSFSQSQLVQFLNIMLHERLVICIQSMLIYKNHIGSARKQTKTVKSAQKQTNRVKSARSTEQRPFHYPKITIPTRHDQHGIALPKTRFIRPRGRLVLDVGAGAVHPDHQNDILHYDANFNINYRRLRNHLHDRHLRSLQREASS